jgi:DNA-binding transcriptional regulator YhcF (GntR family)
MSFQIVDDILREGCFSAEDKLVMLSLARHASNETRIAWPSVDTIALESSLNRRTVQRRLRRMESLGVIQDVSEYEYFDDTKDKRQRQVKFGGARNSTRYRIAAKEVIRHVMWKDWCQRQQSKPRQIDALKSVPGPLLSASASQ